MKATWMVLLGCAVLFGCGGEKAAEETAAVNAQSEALAEETLPRQESPVSDEAAELGRTDPAGIYGEGITLAAATSVHDILAEPASWEGKKVQIAGTVKEVCAMRGCWIEMADAASGETIRVKVHDGQIVFPKSAAGHAATVEGVVEKLELDLEQARAHLQHEADEKGEPFDSTSVTGPLTIWRLAGSGAKIEG